MANNNIKEYASIIQGNLDKKMVQQSVTGWMESNAGQVKYSGGRKIKIPKIVMDGLGNYDKDNGFTGGSITFEYEEREMQYDRGRSFSVDSIDVDETGFILTAGTVMDTFQREHVAPEVDAVRLSNLAKIAIAEGQADYGYKPAKASALDTLKDAITKVREQGFAGQLIVHCTYDFKNQVEKGMVGQLSPATLSLGGIDTQIPAVDGCPLIPTDTNKMYTNYTLLDGKTEGQKEGGFKKTSDALSMNFMIVAHEVPIAVSKTDKLRVFDPDTNQQADSWKADYRKYHDIWVLDNKKKGIYVNIKDAQPSGAVSTGK